MPAARQRAGAGRWHCLWSVARHTAIADCRHRRLSAFFPACPLALLLKYVGHTATFQAIERGIARSGIDFLILTRLIPLFPYNIQNYAYGLTAIPFWPYTLISALTTLPGIFIYTLMASELAAHGLTLAFILKLSLAGLALFALA